jgi:hypothetical protein
MREQTTKSRLKYVSSCRRRAFATFSLFEPNNSRLGNEILSTLTSGREKERNFKDNLAIFVALIAEAIKIKREIKIQSQTLSPYFALILRCNSLNRL